MTKENSLVKINENGLFYKIKKFFSKMFKNKEVLKSAETIDKLISKKDIKVTLMEDIKGMDKEKLKLLDIQEKYKSGAIREEELTKEQIDALCDLYDMQNEQLRKSNEYRKQQLKEYMVSKIVS